MNKFFKTIKNFFHGKEGWQKKETEKTFNLVKNTQKNKIQGLKQMVCVLSLTQIR